MRPAAARYGSRVQGLRPASSGLGIRTSAQSIGGEDIVDVSVARRSYYTEPIELQPKLPEWKLAMCKTSFKTRISLSWKTSTKLDAKYNSIPRRGLVTSYRSSYILKQRRSDSYFSKNLLQSTASLESRRFASTDIYNRSVYLELGNDKRIEANVTWLRENCNCDQCYNHSTHQRNVLFHHLTSEALTVNQVTNLGQQVKVIWSDGHQSHYDMTWLNKYGSKLGQADPDVKKTLWSAQKLGEIGLTQVKFKDLIHTDEAKGNLLRALLQYGVATVVGTPPNLEGTLEAARRISRPLWTLYGDHWMFGKPDGHEFEDTAYSNIPLGAHTDGTYYLNPAGIQILHCLSSGVVGGESLLVDGFHAAERLRRADPEAFRALTEEFSVDHTYIDKQNELHSHTRVLHLHPITKQLEYIRYNPYDRSHLTPTPLSPSGNGGNSKSTTSNEGTSTSTSGHAGRFYSAMAQLGKLIEDEEAQYWFKLEPGTVLLMDNWRVLHGRAGYSGIREMAGCYLARDDWMSAARVCLLGIK